MYVLHHEGHLPLYRPVLAVVFTDMQRRNKYTGWRLYLAQLQHTFMSI